MKLFQDVSGVGGSFKASTLHLSKWLRAELQEIEGSGCRARA